MPDRCDETLSIPLHWFAPRVPDCRNQGIWLRLLLAANALLLVVALIGNSALTRLPGEIAALAARVEPALLLVLVLLFWLGPWLRRQRPALAFLLVVLLAAVTMAGVDLLLARLTGAPPNWRSTAGAAAAAALLLAWLDLRARAQAPAQAEARLAALTARMRPHFFFNSLNAVLGVLRDDPRRAETALEELGELFRALMRDQRELVPLSDEIALARKYLDIEKLRLGERLQVRWEVTDCPTDLLALPLLLQPLLENAVYHGIEPGAGDGEIRVRIAATRTGVRIEIDNPAPAAGGTRPGNRMALDNLRERLMLFYDLEARLDCGERAGRYHVCIDLPRREAVR